MYCINRDPLTELKQRQLRIMFPDILKVNAAHKKGRLSGHSNRQRQKDRELKNIDINP